MNVKALKLQALRVCARDTDEVRSQTLGGILNTFGEEDCAEIYARVQAVDDLILSWMRFSRT